MQPHENRSIRVAVAQINSVSHDVDGNFSKHLYYIQEARKEKADILLFPELSLHGCLIGPNAYKHAITHAHPMFLEIKRATGNMASIVGFVEEGFGAQYYNSSIILQGGQNPFIHRKLNLCTYGYWTEAKYFAQGRYVERFGLPGRFVGSILICADAWNPALVHLAALSGATILFIPIASANATVSSEFSNPDNWDLTAQFYSMIYGLPIVLANFVGQEENLTFWGRSQIVSPFGKTLDRLGPEQEGLLVADLDYEQVQKARFQLPTVRDSNISLIQREMHRMVDTLGIPVGIHKQEYQFGKDSQDSKS